MSVPQITIVVRHAAGCKYEKDSFSKRCNCRKSLRWFANGKVQQRKTGTRAWSEAEKAKRELEDQLAGRAEAPKAKTVRDCVTVFLADKKVQGIAADTIARYSRELERLAAYCENAGVFTIDGVTREVLTGFCGTWPKFYPSSVTRFKARERCRGFLRYCYEAQWLPRVPALPKMKQESTPTLPLTRAEFQRLLDAIPAGLPHSQAAGKRVKVRALFLLMRWSGLAIRDALMLRRDAILHDARRGIFRVVTHRQKTGTDVSVPIPPDVAAEVLALSGTHPEYLFWSGKSSGKNLSTKFQTRFVLPVFKAANLYGDGHMVSHRLRDTFAVDLLERGVPMEEVSKALGHTSIKTTEKHYAKWVSGRQDRLDSLVMGTWAQPETPQERPMVN